jgi:ABC-2 type transport system ATP-binding protein
VNFLETINVVKHYSGHLALDSVSISVPGQKIFGLLGPNGSGKTTLLRIINRITAPDSGEILFLGRPSRHSDIFRIGYLPEERGLYRKMKSGDQAVYLARLKGLTARDATARLRTLFRRFDLLPAWNKTPEELSKGIQQKLQFIITVVHEPELLIFDEPFSGFDPLNTELLKNEILRLREEGKTIIFSTHNMPSVDEICDETAFLNRSKIVLSGSVESIRNRFRQHIFRLTTTTPLSASPSVCEILSQQPLHSTYLSRVRKNPSISSSEFLTLLIRNNSLLSFEEEFPSMHDIFIQTVS